MEEHQALTRLVPIERKIIITSVVKYLLTGKAIYGDCSKCTEVHAERLANNLC